MATLPGIDKEFEKIIIGDWHAIGLAFREPPDDLHIVVTIMTEDDGSWFISDSYFSSSLFEPLQDLMIKAMAWLNEHCQKEYSGYSDRTIPLTEKHPENDHI